MHRTTAQGALSEGRDKEKQAYALVNQLRDFAEFAYTAKFKRTTVATNTLEAIWTSDTVPEGVAWEVQADIVGRATAGGAARARYIVAGTFYRETGGALTQEGVTVTILSIESVAGFDADLAVSGNTVLARVRDDGVRTMNWSAMIRAREVS